MCKKNKKATTESEWSLYNKVFATTLLQENSVELEMRVKIKPLNKLDETFYVKRNAIIVDSSGNLTRACQIYEKELYESKR